MQEKPLYEFGRFRVDLLDKTLLSDEQPILLPPKAFDILLVLIEHGGSVVEKDALLAAVWPNVFVEENNLTQYISLLRKTLGDNRRTPCFIQTVARRGYRFCCPVKRIGVQREELPADILAPEKGPGAPPKSAIHEAAIETIASQPVARWRAAISAHAGLLLLTCLGLAAVVLVSRRISSHTPLVSAAGPASIVILPYEMASREQTENFEGVALADDLTRQLNGQSASLRVRPVSAIYRYSETTVDPATAARQLGVNFAFTARVEDQPGRTLVNARLVRAQDGVTVWTQSFKADRQHPFALQDRLIKAVEEALALRTGGGPALPRHITGDLQAYGAYMHGRMLWDQRTSEGLYRSVDYLDQAIARDPKFALAYSALADTYAFDLGNRLKAEATARTALTLDPGLGAAHASLGLVRLLWMHDPEGATEEFRMAIRMDPNYASAHEWYADNFASQGRMPEAIEEMRNAMGLDGDSVPIATDVARMYYLAREYGLARDQCRRTLQMDPTSLSAHILMHDIDVQDHEYDDAMAEYAKIQQLAGAAGLYSSSQSKVLAKAYAVDGIKGFWRARVDYLETSYRDEYQLAKYLALLGRYEDSLLWLQRATDRSKQGKMVMLYVYSEPVFEGLRYDSRFKKITGLD